LQAAALNRGIFPAYKTNHPKPSYIKRITFTLCDLHYLLAYASPEVVKHIAKTSADITIDISILYLVTLDYEIYAISKATVVISRIANSENPTNSKPFDEVDWDLIIRTPTYLIWPSNSTSPSQKCLTLHCLQVTLFQTQTKQLFLKLMDINKKSVALITLFISLAPNILVQQKYYTNSCKIRYNSILIPQTISSTTLSGRRI
jgi:hypothetical protein